MSRRSRLVMLYATIFAAVGLLLTPQSSAYMPKAWGGLILGAAIGYLLDYRLARRENRRF